MTGNEARDTDDVDLFEDTAGEKSPPEEDSLDADFFFRNPMMNNASYPINNISLEWINVP